MSELRTDSREWVHRIMGSLDRMLVGIENLDLTVGLNVARSHFALAGCLDVNGLGTVTVQAGNDALDVQHDLGDVFLDARDGGELMDNAVDLHAGNSNTGQTGQKDPSERIAQGVSEASLQRTCYEFTVGIVFRHLQTLYRRLFYFNH